jgi:hypothetical protein
MKRCRWTSRTALVSFSTLVASFPTLGGQIGPIDERQVFETTSQSVIAGTLVEKYGLSKLFAEQVLSSGGQIHCNASDGGYNVASGFLVGSNEQVATNAHFFVDVTYPPQSGSRQNKCVPRPKTLNSTCYFESFAGRRSYIDANDPRLSKAISNYMLGCKDSSKYVLTTDLAVVKLLKPIEGSEGFPVTTRVKPKKGMKLLQVSGAQEGLVDPAKDDPKKTAFIVLNTCSIRVVRPSGGYLTDCDVDYGASGAPEFDITDPLNPKLIGLHVNHGFGLPNGSNFNASRMRSGSAPLPAGFGGKN